MSYYYPYSATNPYGMYPQLQPVTSIPYSPPPPSSNPPPVQPSKPPTSSSSSSSSKSSSKTSKDSDEPRYTLKTIHYQGRKVQMLCQAFNGPCPLLAICNVLLLRGKIAIKGGPTIRGSQLLEVVVNSILSDDPNVKEEDLKTIMQLLPTLQKGLDVNVFFTKGIYGFDETDAFKLFKLVNVPLVHGWLADPNDPLLYSALDGLSFNSAQLAQVDEKISDDKRVLIQAWLETSRQLTITGLEQIYSEFPKLPPVSGCDDRLGVLFCNNHFSAVCFHRGRLYSLVTDEGFANRSAVWELIQDTNGDSLFFREDFTPYNTYSASYTAPPPSSSSSSQKPPQKSTVPASSTTSSSAGKGASSAAKYDMYQQDPYAHLYSGNNSGTVGSSSPNKTTTVPDSDEALARSLQEQERKQNIDAKKQQEDADLAMALSLQQQEEQRAAAAQQQYQQQQYYAQQQRRQQESDCRIM